MSFKRFVFTSIVALLWFFAGMQVQEKIIGPKYVPPTVIIQGCYLEDNSWPEGLNRDLSNLKEVYAGLKDRRLKLDSAIHAQQVKNGSQEHY